MATVRIILSEISLGAFGFRGLGKATGIARNALIHGFITGRRLPRFFHVSVISCTKKRISVWNNGRHYD
jgi:hypothetical protein